MAAGSTNSAAPRRPTRASLLARGLLGCVPARPDCSNIRTGAARRFRAAAVDDRGCLAEALLVGPPGLLPGREWLLSLLASREPLSALDRRALLSGRPPLPMPAVGRIVCSCFNVGVNQLASAVAAGCDSLDAIGSQRCAPAPTAAPAAPR